MQQQSLKYLATTTYGGANQTFQAMFHLDLAALCFPDFDVIVFLPIVNEAQVIFNYLHS